LHDHHLLSFQAFALHAKAKKSEEEENSGEPAKKPRKTKASIKKPASSPASTTKPKKREKKPRTPRPVKDVTLAPIGGTKVSDKGHYQGDDQPLLDGAISIEPYLRALLGSREGFSFEYSADNCGHVVDQGITFNAASRESEARDVAKDMRKRNQIRANVADKMAACDKIINPLVALPGSPGSGKSTFLVHLPESAAYQQYLNDTDRPAAIVSTLTFNSGMTTPGEADALGLRIIYGGMCAMLGTELFPMMWEDFRKKNHGSKHSRPLCGRNAAPPVRFGSTGAAACG
jgi:hypothetical protein